MEKARHWDLATKTEITPKKFGGLNIDAIKGSACLFCLMTDYTTTFCEMMLSWETAAGAR